MPALVNLVEVDDVGELASTQLRDVRQISPGNVVNPNGIAAGGRG
jgi:hypothetical protein